MQESHSHFAKWKKPEKKEYTLYDSIYRNACMELKTVVIIVMWEEY